MNTKYEDKTIEIRNPNLTPEMIQIDDEDEDDNVQPIYQNCSLDSPIEIKSIDNPPKKVKVVEEYQLDDDEISEENINLKPIDMNSSILSNDNPRDNLIINHHSTEIANSTSSLSNHLTDKSKLTNQTNETTTSNQQMNNHPENIQQSSLNVQNLIDNNLKDEQNQSTNSQIKKKIKLEQSNDEQQSIMVQQKETREINIRKVSLNPGDSNSRTVTLKIIPPINGIKSKDNSPVDESITFSSSKSQSKGTTKPIIQTFSPVKPVTPKLIIKPPKPPSTVEESSASTSSSPKTNVSNKSMTDQKCIREGCQESAIKSDHWDNEYCSEMCLIKNCKQAFKAWIKERKNRKSEE